jgi:hypothetical protein
MPRPLSQTTAYTRSNVFTFTLPLSEGRAAEAWETSNKITFFVLSQEFPFLTARLLLFLTSQFLSNSNSLTHGASVIILKDKAKLSLCLTNLALNHEGSTLTLALVGGERLVSRPCRFIPEERAPGTHWIGGWVGPRAGLDVVEKRIFLTSPRLEL